MKKLLVIDINDELLEDYENFYVEYDLWAERKGENVIESIRYVEEAELKSMPEKREVKTDFIGVGDYDFDDIYNAGFNDCIDEIEGKE